MFFWIRCERAPELVEWDELLDALDNLGEAGFKGDHLVMGDRNVLIHIIKNVTLSRKASAYFKSVIARYASLGALKNKIKCIMVSPECSECTQVYGIYNIPLSFFNVNNSASAAYLLSEHMHDYEVIVALGNSDIFDRGMGSVVKLNFQPAAGGGGGAHLMLSTLQRMTHTLGLCVVDSDRCHLNDALGNTARSCINNNHASWKWSVHILGARELENIIPPDFIIRAEQEPSPTYVDYYSDDLWPIYGYIDIKTSDKLCRFYAIPRSSSSYDVTSRAIKNIHRNIPRSAVCVENNDCELCGYIVNIPRPNCLANIANWLRGLANSFPRVINNRVDALNNLLTDVINVGVAARWSVT